MLNKIFQLFLFFFLTGLFPSVPQAFEISGKLEIHYINVGQGSSVLIIGPDGTRLMYDFGNPRGNKYVVPYLEKINLKETDGIHYSIVSHNHQDHFAGYQDVAEKYNFLTANYGPSIIKKPGGKLKSNWITPAQKTKAGPVKPIDVGLRIPLGDGAEIFVAASNGKIIGKEGQEAFSSPNDASISLLIRYGRFQYILDGDMGAGKEDCTGHDATKQKNIQPKVAQALIDYGLVDKTYGVDGIHIAHHGSESSTSAQYFNLLKPEFGLIGVGQNCTYYHPRKVVVDNVLVGDNRPDCVTAPPLKLLMQTDGGNLNCGDKKTAQVSTTAKPVGDIKLVTDGNESYTISASNNPKYADGSGENFEPMTFPLDELL